MQIRHVEHDGLFRRPIASRLVLQPNISAHGILQLLRDKNERQKLAFSTPASPDFYSSRAAKKIASALNGSAASHDLHMWEGKPSRAVRRERPSTHVPIRLDPPGCPPGRVFLCGGPVRGLPTDLIRGYAKKNSQGNMARSFPRIADLSLSGHDGFQSRQVANSLLIVSRNAYVWTP
jgi:hypothetical protein